MPLALIFFQQKFVILFSHIIIRYTQHQTHSARGGDSKHAVIEEQAGENLRFGEIGGGEGSEQCGNYLPPSVILRNTPLRLPYNLSKRMSFFILL